MYCKNCGKEIADDSKFCQYCGTAQQQEQVCEPKQVVEEPKREVTLEIPSIKTNLSKEAKICIGVYAVWFLVNLVCIFLDYRSLDYASEYFYPFTKEYKTHYIRHYDITEFLVYTFIVPIVLYGIYKFWKFLPENK